MALYPKNPKYYFLKEWDSLEFEDLFYPEQEALHAGIYRCEVCGHEIGHPGNSPLPAYKPPNHLHEGSYEGKDIVWRLIISTHHQYRRMKTV
jgi:hypothetical protein